MHKQRQIAARQNEIIDTQTTHMESGLKVAQESADAATKAAAAAEIQASFTAAQKRISDKQLTQMQEGLEVAKTNADAAKASAETASKALVLLNRPYLDATNWTLEYRHGEGYGDPPISHIGFCIANRSTTPARLEKLEVMITVGDHGDDFLKSGVVRVFISPAHETPFTYAVPFWPNDAAAKLFYSDVGVTVKVRGRIEYTDLFGGRSKPRVKQFCRIFVVSWTSQRGFTYDVSTPLQDELMTFSWEEENEEDL